MGLGWPLVRPKKSLLSVDSEKAHMCYASMRHAAKFQTDTASIANKTKAPVMKSGSLTGI